MNLKKLVAISHHFPNCASSRKKVVSGFGLGFVSFFIFLFVLFWKFSFKNPTPNQLFFFQEFNSTYSSSSRRSIFVENATQAEQTPKILVSENIDESNGSNISLEFLDFDGKNGSFNGISEKSVDFNNTHFIKLKDDVKNASFNGILEKSVDFNDTHFIKLKDDVKNASFNGILEKSVDFNDTHFIKLKDDVKNASFNGILEKSVDFNDTHFIKLKDDVKHASFNGILEKSVDFNDTHFIKLKDDVKNASFSAILVNPNEGLVEIGEKSGNGSVKSDGLDLNLDGFSNKRGFADTDDATISQNLGNLSKDCDIFDGRWVRDDTKPYYPLGSCPYVDRDLDCHLNGRPDDEFVKWRWQPFGCEIPSLNATNFLERLRGKKLVFVGDSLNRNMWESLVCILQHSIKNKKKVYEISGKREFKKKGVYAFRFEDYNCTIDFVWSPFLVRESSFKGKNGTFETLRLDLMDRTTSMYRDADVLIFNTGHWWTHEKTSRGEDYYQEGNHVYPRLKALDAYTRALSTWARWVDKNIDSQKTQVIFRGYSVTHFRGGQWNSGGQCHKETEPIFNTSQLSKYPSKMRAFDNVMRAMNTPVIYLNISRLTDYRKDGHPSVYRKMYKSMTLKQQIGAEQSQDCSHWCLPGVPDAWNELLYASLLKVGRGSWKS